MLIVSDTGSISLRLVDAIEREFPWIHVEQVKQVGSACATFPHPVSLILLDQTLVAEAEAVAGELVRLHPQALTAVIQSGDKSAAYSLLKIGESSLIRSVLPMDLRLDIWLSIIRLMLCGGEYLPPGDIVQAKPHNQPPRPVVPKQSPSHDRVVTLTTREIQILQMVTRGLQNKLIAVELGLSEHTVKVHLHNIIRKLGVHNRTEAAARFYSLSANLALPPQAPFN